MTAAAITLLDEAAVRSIVAGVVREELAGLESRLLRALAKRAGDEPEGMLGPAALAQRLSISKRELLRGVGEGRIPQPVYVGDRSPRWSLKAIRFWEAARCPRGNVPGVRRTG